MATADLPLRDLHLPAPPGWWPPAPGWWLLLLLLIGIGLLIYYYRRRKQATHKPDIVKAARQALHRIETTHAEDGDDAALIRELSSLLRRICLSLYPRAEIASLTGERWLTLLDRALSQPQFSQGPGRLLTEAPYRLHAELDAVALLQLTHEWLDAVTAPQQGDIDAAP